MHSQIGNVDTRLGLTVSGPSTTRLRIVSLQGGSVGRGACGQAWRSEFYHQHPHGGKNEWLQQRVLWLPHMHRCRCAHTRKYPPHPPKIRIFCVACSLAHGSMFCLLKVPACPTANSGIRKSEGCQHCSREFFEIRVASSNNAQWVQP